jgi:hypothetical protein
MVSPQAKHAAESKPVQRLRHRSACKLPNQQEDQVHPKIAVPQNSAKEYQFPSLLFVPAGSKIFEITEPAPERSAVDADAVMFTAGCGFRVQPYVRLLTLIASGRQ